MGVLSHAPEGARPGGGGEGTLCTVGLIGHFTCVLHAPQIFQLLLPEVGTDDSKNMGALILLLVLTALAPFLSWASHLAAGQKPALRKDARWVTHLTRSLITKH